MPASLERHRGDQDTLRRAWGEPGQDVLPRRALRVGVMGGQPVQKWQEEEGALGSEGVPASAR